MKYFYYFCLLTWWICDASPLNNWNKFRRNIHQKKSNQISRTFNRGEHHVSSSIVSGGQLDHFHDYQLNTPIQKISNFQVQSNDYIISIRATLNTGTIDLSRRNENDYTVPSSDKNYQNVYIQTHSYVPSPNRGCNNDCGTFKRTGNISPTPSTRNNVHPINNHDVRFPLCDKHRHYKVVLTQISDLPTTTPKTDTYQIFTDLNIERNTSIVHPALPGIWSYPKTSFEKEYESPTQDNNSFHGSDPDSPEIVVPTLHKLYNNSMDGVVFGIVDPLPDNMKPEVEPIPPEPNDNDSESEFKNNDENAVVPAFPQPVYNEYGEVEPIVQPEDNESLVDEDRHEIKEPIAQTNDSSFVVGSVFHTKLPDSRKLDNDEYEYDIVETTHQSNDSTLVDADDVYDVLKTTPESTDSKPDVDADGYEIIGPTPQTNDTVLVTGSKDENGYEIIEPTSLPDNTEQEGYEDVRRIVNPTGWGPNQTKPEDTDDVHGIVEPTPLPDEHNFRVDSTPQANHTKPDDDEITEPTPQPNENNFINEILSATPQKEGNKYAPKDYTGYELVEPISQPVVRKPDMDDDGHKITEPPQPNGNNSTADNVGAETNPNKTDDVIIEPTPLSIDSQPTVQHKLVEPIPQPNANHSDVESMMDVDEYSQPDDLNPKETDYEHENHETTRLPVGSGPTVNNEIVEATPQPNANNSIGKSVDDNENSKPGIIEAEFASIPQPNNGKSGIVKPIYHRDNEKSDDEINIMTSTLQPNVEINHFEDADIVSSTANIKDSGEERNITPKPQYSDYAATEEASDFFDINDDYDDYDILKPNPV